jgi:hypothetical protein
VDLSLYRINTHRYSFRDQYLHPFLTRHREGRGTLVVLETRARLIRFFKVRTAHFNVQPGFTGFKNYCETLSNRSANLNNPFKKTASLSKPPSTEPLTLILILNNCKNGYSRRLPTAMLGKPPPRYSNPPRKLPIQLLTLDSP